MATTTTTTPGQRALLLGWAAAFTLAEGLAWVVVLALVLARLDRFIPRKPATPASNASMESMDAMTLDGAIAGLDLDGAADGVDALRLAVARLEGTVAAPVRYRLPYDRIRGTN
jgi:hypothetical protein